MATKQEEIREGIAEKIYKEAPGWRGGYEYVSFKFAPEVVREQYLRKADEWIVWFDSQGVVIKVERELPAIRFSRAAVKVYDRNNKPISHADAAIYTQQDMIGAGYVATEPLIKE